MTTSTLGPATLQGTTRKVLLRLVLAWLGMPVLFLLPAGTLRWWQAWVYCIGLLVPMSVFVLLTLRTDPEFLQRRIDMREKERTQRRVLSWGAPVFAALYILPGLDHRFGWSAVPLTTVIVAQVSALLGYLAVLRVFYVNRWAGRTIEVVAGQKLVTTGPYAIVRHPMYTASLVLYLATPLALGSYWGLIPALLSTVVLVLRIGNEEEVLLRELPGYAEYRASVRYRLVPLVW